MAKLYFKYGAMGSSKTAQALITKYNYEENDLSVWLIKPSADTRDGAAVLRSRIGLDREDLDRASRIALFCEAKGILLLEIVWIDGDGYLPLCRFFGPKS